MSHDYFVWFMHGESIKERYANTMQYTYNGPFFSLNKQKDNKIIEDKSHTWPRYYLGS